jgi:hypothetical protein
MLGGGGDIYLDRLHPEWLRDFGEEVDKQALRDHGRLKRYQGTGLEMSPGFFVRVRTGFMAYLTHPSISAASSVATLQK